MAIKKAPKKILPSEIENVINKGGSVKSDKQFEKLWRMINLRIPAEVIREIDVILKDRYMMTRTSFILEAIDEKLKASK